MQAKKLAPCKLLTFKCQTCHSEVLCIVAQCEKSLKVPGVKQD